MPVIDYLALENVYFAATTSDTVVKSTKTAIRATPSLLPDCHWKVHWNLNWNVICKKLKCIKRKMKNINVNRVLFTLVDSRHRTLRQWDFVRHVFSRYNLRFSRIFNVLKEILRFYWSVRYLCFKKYLILNRISIKMDVSTNLWQLNGTKLFK